MKEGKPETITWLNDQMISIEHSVNVIHSISPLLRADKSKNTQFINGTKKLRALFVFPGDSGLSSERN
jgi:hypothetical protein